MVSGKGNRRCGERCGRNLYWQRTGNDLVADGDLNLEVVDVNGPLPKDAVQTALNTLTKKLNDNYPLGIHADSVKVTDTGVVGTFSSQNASIPKEDANPCFARL